MRIRSIKPEFFTHEALFDLEKETGLPLRVAFAGLWCAADREGRFKWEPRRLGVSILPYDLIDFSRVLDALTTRGFIRQYHVKGEAFGYIPSFTRHQVINNREKSSDLPEPPENEQVDASATREAREDHACKAEGKGREGKGREESSRAREDFPTLEEVLAAGQLVMADTHCCTAYFNDRQAAGWVNKHGQPFRDWRADFRNYATRWRANDFQRQNSFRGPNNNQPRKLNQSCL
jgi:hypothetical protein